jgi:5-oxoprolinase (ATP-hydrolysing) subunit A
MDLNSDLGAGFGTWRRGDDRALLSIVSSGSVACGFHGGDAHTMRQVCTLASLTGVVVGAQVGYRDLAGFGQRRIDYDPVELCDEICYQIGALSAFGQVRYVKPHGALYTAAAVDDAQAGAVVAACKQFALPVLCQPRSALARLAALDGVPVVAEGFADRAYRSDGRLVPRSAAGAVLGEEAALAQALRLALEGEVVAASGEVVRCPVASICVPGDTPGAVTLARRVREALVERGVPVKPFV